MNPPLESWSGARLNTLPGPGDFPIPDEECARFDPEPNIWKIGDSVVDVPWCLTHDQPWSECGGREPPEPDYDYERIHE